MPNSCFVEAENWHNNAVNIIFDCNNSHTLCSIPSNQSIIRTPRTSKKKKNSSVHMYAELQFEYPDALAREKRNTHSQPDEQCDLRCTYARASLLARYRAITNTRIYQNRRLFSSSNVGGIYNSDARREIKEDRSCCPGETHKSAARCIKYISLCVGVVE